MAETTQLHTTHIGSGERTIVFLHGLFGRGKNFTTAAKGLEPECTSILVDLPNHGASAWTETFDYVQMADSVAEVLRDAGAEDRPVGMVGHSMGGKVAMVTALRHPELIDRLVVEDISPVPHPAAEVGAAEDESAGGEFAYLLDALADLDLSTLQSRSQADELLAASVHSAAVRGFLLQNLRHTDAGFSWQPNLHLLRESLATIGDFPDMGSRTFDGLVLWMAGEKSDYITPAASPAMRALFPRALRITIKGAGHWIHSEQPEGFLKALRRFFLT